MNTDALLRLAEHLKDQLGYEFKAQGHSLSGSTIAGLYAKVTAISNGFSVEVWTDAPQVIFSLDQRVQPQNIKTPINELKKFVRARGMASDEKEVTRIAWAIKNKHLQEGMSTAASKRFSKTGKRDHFVQDMLEREKQFIEKSIVQWAREELSHGINMALKIA